MGDDRPAVYHDDDGRWVYRASAVGSCIRALVAARQGYAPMPFPDRTLQIMEEGNIHEPHILAAVSQQGYAIASEQDEVEVPVIRGVVIRGHIDGIASTGGVDRVVDAKAMSKDVFEKWSRHGLKAFPRYAIQLAIYMGALGLGGMMACKNRNDGTVDVKTFDELPIKLSVIKAKVARVEMLAKKGELPTCDTEDQWGCVYRYLHEAREPDDAYDEDEVIDALAGEYHRTALAVKQAEERQRECRTRLIKALGERSRCKTSSWSVTRVEANRKRLDMEALKEAVDVRPFETAYLVEQLRVSAVKPKGAKAQADQAVEE